MFRRSLVINCAFSLVSTALIMAMMPTAGSLTSIAKSSFLTYAQEDSLLAPLVHRTLLVR
jgi:hypothetical protein